MLVLLHSLGLQAGTGKQFVVADDEDNANVWKFSMWKLSSLVSFKDIYIKWSIICSVFKHESQSQWSNSKGCM